MESWYSVPWKVFNNSREIIVQIDDPTTKSHILEATDLEFIIKKSPTVFLPWCGNHLKLAGSSIHLTTKCAKQDVHSSTRSSVFHHQLSPSTVACYWGGSLYGKTLGLKWRMIGNWQHNCRKNLEENYQEKLFTAQYDALKDLYMPEKTHKIQNGGLNSSLICLQLE